MNIYDISEKAGVSIATVSRVINGSDKVNKKTKEKVLSVIESSGYTPNAFARGLGLNSMKTIGIMCANSSDAYIAKAIYYIERMLRQNGYDVLLCCTGYEAKTKMKYLSLLISKRVDSIILVGSDFVELEDTLNQYIKDAAKSIPIMLLNGLLDGNNIYSTLCDDFHAVFDATSDLITSGKTDIMYLYNSNSYSGQKKLSGYKAALEKYNIPVRNELIQLYNENEITINGVKNFILKLKQKGLDFNAVIASEDSLAIGALKFAKKAGLSVPNDLSIIGYNNSDIAQCCDPELTSIDNKCETLCKQCVEILVGTLMKKEMPKKIFFTAELIKRGTTKF